MSQPRSDIATYFMSPEVTPPGQLDGWFLCYSAQVADSEGVHQLLNAVNWAGFCAMAESRLTRE